jgi:hypothetical protein
MGTLIYDNTDSFVFDDGVLAHLQAVIATKLHRREGFQLTWWDRTTLPAGTLRSVWLEASISIQFVFSRPQLPPLDREWMSKLLEQANSVRGLVLGEEGEPA